jgi:hypothetical protein
MKIYLILLMVFLSIVSYSQKSSIVVHKKNSEKIKEIAENKRIKIITLEGKKYYGRFTIVDSASIKIEGNVVALDSITRIRRKSLFGAIVNPMVVGFGLANIFGGFVALAAPGSNMEGALGSFLLTTGVVLVAVSAISSSYKSKKWDYSIKYNNENDHFPSSNILKKTGTEP